MFRLIFWFLIFYFIYLLIKKFKNPKKKKIKIKIKNTVKEKMVQCDNCGIYSPESSVIKAKGKIFCSEKCMKEYFNNEKN